MLFQVAQLGHSNDFIHRMLKRKKKKKKGGKNLHNFTEILPKTSHVFFLNEMRYTYTNKQILEVKGPWGATGIGRLHICHDVMIYIILNNCVAI